MATTVSTSSAHSEMTAKELIEGMTPAEQDALKGWYWYDWANQAYALTVMTVIVPALMANLYNTATGTQGGAGFYALIYGIAMLIVAVTAPALGVIADRMPIKKKLLFWYTLAGVIFCAAMGAAPYFGSKAYMVLAMMYVFGSIGFSGGNTIYYAFMPYLAPQKSHGSCFILGICIRVFRRLYSSFVPSNRSIVVTMGFKLQPSSRFRNLCFMVVGLGCPDVLQDA